MKRTYPFKKSAMSQKTDMQNKYLLNTAQQTSEKLLLQLGSSYSGLNEEYVQTMRQEYGRNIISQEKKDTIFKKLLRSFIDPFTLVLLSLALISFCTDVLFVGAEDRDFTAGIIVLIMVFLSGSLKFIQEIRSGNAAEKLKALVKTTVLVEREETGKQELPVSDIVQGDIIHLAAGDMIPADVRILSSKDLFISQSALTGESEPVEKFPNLDADHFYQTPLECPNLAFMGTNVISGSATCVAVAIGNDTMFGTMAKSIMRPKIKTGFEKGVQSVSKLLIRFMLVMVPIVLFINGFTKGDWLEATLFALSVAVGLTPEMLPMIVTTNLAKGAAQMSKKKTIIKNLNSVQNFGSMNVLCTDKTGTLTQDKVVLEYHLDIHGNEDDRVFRHAFLNSYFQTGLRNLMDVAILEYAQKYHEGESLKARYQKVDEIPFDFSRRRMSVVVRDTEGKTQMVTKGAVEEMLQVCAFAEYKNVVEPLTEEVKQEILETVKGLNENGMRVLAIAQKNNPSAAGTCSVQDESDMVLMGYLAFLDPPKETTKAAIEALKTYGVSTKILTGDNDAVTRCICRQVGLKVDNLLLGSDIELLTDSQLAQVVETTNVFAKLSPEQKTRIVHALRENGHTVGFMGDGINDASAMKEADVGISVDTAVDIAKESADIILLEKDLMVLEQGVIEGRKIFGNIIKYIKMTASSNFGNMLSVLAASIFLPFLPMLPIQILVLNLIYDISCISIPWDNMDPEFLKCPRKWDSSSIGKFMIWMGPVSSIFDIITYVILYFVICPAVCGGSFGAPGVNSVLFMALFHAGWFVESLWSQTLVIHMIRTPKVPFIQSRASLPVLVITTIAIIVGTVIPYTPLGAGLGMAALPAIYFAWLAGIIFAYMVLITVVKKIFVKKYGDLL